MHEFNILDAHCDTAGLLSKQHRLWHNSGHLDLERMRSYRWWMQFFAIWVDPQLSPAAQAASCDAMIDQYYAQLRENADYITPVTTAAQAQAALRHGRAAAFLTIEGAGPIGNTLSGLYHAYERGVRCITLTWNHTNLLATGAGERRPKFGLTPFGREVVVQMNRLGMLVDVSHSSERTFWDVCELTCAPIIASHSNAKAVHNHVRNLTDQQFLAICKMGGVVGINYYPEFVNGNRTCTIDDIVRHIEHFCALGGAENIGLGGDFDGIGYTPSDLCGVQDVYALLNRLLSLGYSETLVKKIASENFLRLVQHVCG